eukprot:8590223-Lingulodinium_polyedra.AAC.1
MMLAWIGPAAGKSKPPCTPAAVQRLPPQAIEDLRGAFHTLELTLGISAPAAVVPAAIPAAIPLP